MRGTHITMREVALIKTAKLVIRSPEEPLMLHTDGELREPGVNECTVELDARQAKRCWWRDEAVGRLGGFGGSPRRWSYSPPNRPTA